MASERPGLAGVIHGVVTDHERDVDAEPAKDVERRAGDRRGNDDRRKKDSGPPDGAEKRKGERRQGERRAKGDEPTD